MALEDLALGGGVLTHIADAMSTRPSLASITARAIVFTVARDRRGAYGFAAIHCKSV